MSGGLLREDLAKALQGQVAVALRKGFQSHRAAIGDLPESGSHPGVMDLAGTGLVAPGDVRHMHVPDDLPMVSNRLDDVAFLHLSVVNIDQEPDARAVDLPDQSSPVFQVGEGVTGVVDLGIEHFEVVRYIFLFSDFRQFAQAPVGGDPQVRGMLGDSEILLFPEYALAELLNRHPGLISEAAEKSTVLATPSTILAMLEWVRGEWRYAEHVGELGKVAVEMAAAVRTFAVKYRELGKRLGGARQMYNGGAEAWAGIERTAGLAVKAVGGEPEPQEKI